MIQMVNAYQKYIRETPRKLRLVADMVRGTKVKEALTQLAFTNKKAAKTLHQVITQAQANAINNNHLIPDSLKINTIDIQEGPTFKRWQPVSRGRAHPILKRSSHIKVVISGEEQSTKPEPAKSTK